MYEHRKHAGFDLDFEPSNHAGVMWRVPVHLPMDRLVEVDPEPPPFPVDGPGGLQLTAAKDGEHPAKKAEPPPAGQDQQVESAIVHSSPGRRIEPAGVLTGVRDHHDRRPDFRDGDVIDHCVNGRGGESQETPNGGQQVGEMPDRPASLRREIMDDVGIEADRRHQHHGLRGPAVRGGRGEIDALDHAITKAADDLVDVVGHLEFTGEEILVSRRKMNQWNVRVGGLGRRGSDRAVAADHHQSIMRRQRLAQPGGGRFGPGRHQDDFETGVRGGPLQIRGRLEGPTGARDRVVDHQRRHEGLHDTPGHTPGAAEEVPETIIHRTPSTWVSYHSQRMKSLAPSPSSIGFLTLAALVMAVGLAGPASARQETYELGDDDVWQAEDKPTDAAARQVVLARRALALGEPQRARALASAFLDKFPGGEARPEMLLVRGDALVEMRDEYKALFDYEAITRTYSGSRAFVTALEREYQIAVAYANGLKRKFLGTIRLINADDDAEELLIRIQERLPGSRLAEDAGMELADFYFIRSKMRLAADAYDLFIQNYPRSDRIEKARQRLIQAYLASFRGPRYDDTGLRDAKRRLEVLETTQPGLAQRIGAEALLVRIEESEARKLLTTAEWYLSIDDPVSAEQYLRRVVEKHPATVAALDGLRIAPTILASMPAGIAAECPDYRAMAEALLGAAGPVETGVEARPEVPLPTSRSLAPEVPVDATATPESTP